jgi:hypothetical protein
VKVMDYVTRMREALARPQQPAPRLTLEEYLSRTFANVRDEPDREVAARSIARATTIVGQMLEDMGERRRPLGGLPGYVVRAGRIIWLLIEAAAPRRLGNLLFQHWIAIAWLVAIVVFGIGFVFDNAGLRSVGVRLLIGVFALQLAVNLLNRWIRNVSVGPAAIVFFMALAATIVLGFWMKTIDDQMAARHADLRNASFFAGQLVTHQDVLDRLGGANVELMRSSLKIDLLFIASYVVALMALGAAIGAVRPLAALGLLLASVDLLEDFQVFHALDPQAVTPYVWQLKIGVLVFVVAGIAWILADRFAAWLRSAFRS